MKYIKSINELFLSPGYLNRIAVPSSEVGEIKWSRFVEWTPEFSQGWELMGMQEVDSDGWEISETYIAIDKFIYEQGLSEDQVKIMKSAMSEALHQMGKAKWIEGIKFEENKANGLICLGKIGLMFKNKLYSPIFRYSRREGNLFWIVADFYKGNQIARSVMITKPDISRYELERNSIDIQNAHYRMDFDVENKKRKEENRPLLREPKTVSDERAFVNQLSIVKETGEKQFFVIYVDDSKYDRIQFAKRMAGANIHLDLPRETLAVSGEKKRTYSKSIDYFYLDINANPRYNYLLNKFKNDPAKLREVKDLGSRMKILLYEEGGKFNYGTIVNVSVTPADAKSDSMTLTLSTGKGPKNIRITSGTKLRIPVFDESDLEKIQLFNVKIGKVNPKDKKKVPVTRI